MSNVFVAADPEVVVVNAEGEPVPCVGILPGSKDRPFANEFGEIMEDNVLAEFTINPQNEEDKFVEAFDLQIAALEALLVPHNLSISFKSSVNFDPKDLLTEQAQEAGCDPDYNPWIPDINPAVNLRETTLRTAAGHIHMDIPDADHSPENRLRVAKACDLYIGVPLVLLSNDIERRKLYGGAGAHRPKPYGIEYRAPDNFWVQDKYLRGWVFRMVQRIAKDYKNIAYYADRRQDRILSAINDDNLEAAKELYMEFCPEHFINKELRA